MDRQDPRGDRCESADNGLNTTCISITNSHIFANHLGVEMMANNSLLGGNEIDHFGEMRSTTRPATSP